jgi:hypothetical protein
MDDKKVLDLSKRKFEWMTHKNLDSLASVLDDNLKYVHSNGWIQSKQDVTDDFRSGKISLSDVIIEDASVRLYEHTAIINGKGKFTGTMNDKPFSLELMYTEVYVYKNNKWLLASRHANRL